MALEKNDSSTVDSHRPIPAPFLTKTYQLVDDKNTDEIVSWGSESTTFVVWKPMEFARDLLPNYFKHNNFSSFVRQLNTYGFRKVVPDRWEFGNEFFRKGAKSLLCEIQRRKTTTSSATTPTTANAISISQTSALTHRDDKSHSSESPTNSLDEHDSVIIENEQLRRDNAILFHELSHLRYLYLDLYFSIQKQFQSSNQLPSRDDNQSQVLHPSQNSSTEENKCIAGIPTDHLNAHYLQMCKIWNIQQNSETIFQNYFQNQSESKTNMPFHPPLVSSTSPSSSSTSCPLLPSSSVYAEHMQNGFLHSSTFFHPQPPSPSSFPISPFPYIPQVQSHPFTPSPPFFSSPLPPSRFSPSENSSFNPLYASSIESRSNAKPNDEKLEEEKVSHEKDTEMEKEKDENDEATEQGKSAREKILRAAVSDMKWKVSMISHNSETQRSGFRPVVSLGNSVVSDQRTCESSTWNFRAKSTFPVLETHHTKETFGTPHNFFSGMKEVKKESLESEEARKEENCKSFYGGESLMILGKRSCENDDSSKFEFLNDNVSRKLLSRSNSKSRNEKMDEDVHPIKDGDKTLFKIKNGRDETTI